MTGMTEAERESLGVHTPVWDHDECGFRLDCGCGEFTHFGLTRAEAESRWADHIAPVVERILASRDARLAAVEALATTWEQIHATIEPILGEPPQGQVIAHAEQLRAVLDADPSEAP